MDSGILLVSKDASSMFSHDVVLQVPIRELLASPRDSHDFFVCSIECIVAGRLGGPSNLLSLDGLCP